MIRALKDIDVFDLLPAIAAPTLVIHGRQDPVIPFNLGVELATKIAGARLVAFEGGHEGGASYLATRDAMEAFLTSHPSSSGEPAINAAPRGFETSGAGRVSASAGTSSMAVILFVDIADSTATTERIGDRAFRETARTLDHVLRTCVLEHGGAVIDAKTLGDGILATFPAASQAIAAALACGAAGDTRGLPLHVGLHAGDVIHEEGNVFGGAVNIAARISALSAPSEVLVSATVRDLGRTSAGVTFEDQGEQTLKGIAEPQRVFAVRPSG
jgi:class 3 adenylate cyclase